MAPPINLYVSNNQVTVWDASVVAVLQTVHRILGIRTGTLPGVSQQNGFLGLPLTLMEEEVGYLLGKGVAQLIPLPSYPALSSLETYAKHTASRVAAYKAQQDAFHAMELARRPVQKDDEKARAKREERARKKAEKLAAAGVDLMVESDAGGSQSSKAAVSDASKFSYTHIVPAQPLIPLPEPQAITSLPHALYPYPTTPKQQARLRAFTLMHDYPTQPHYLGLGPRFGGEFLVYPGDILRYHAHYVTQVIVGKETPIRPMELVAWGRLGTGTKKAALICCWDAEGEGEDWSAEADAGCKVGEGEVTFFSLEWANFG